MSVLGALMLSEGAIAAVAETLKSRYFYRPGHGLIYEAVLGLYGRGEPVDLVTVAAELEVDGRLEKVGGKARLVEISTWTSVSANVAHHARIVRDNWTLRAMIDAGGELVRLATERPGEIENLLDLAERRVFALTQEGMSVELELLKAPLADAFQRMAQLADSPSDVIGLPTGFGSIDRVTLGLQPGNLIILAARPSMGKSALALAVAANVSVRYGIPVAFFTLEMSKAETAERLLAMEANVDLRKVRTGRAGGDEWARLVPAAEHLDAAPFWLDDASSQSMVEIRSKARRLKGTVPELGLIVVDYLQLLVRGRHEHKVAETGEIARQLKQLAGDLKVPVVALAQLNRNVEQRVGDKRPVLSDLRDSGEIEQHADLVCFLYRDDYYNEDSPDAGVAELNIAKHRNGPTGTVRLAWLKERAKFSELTRP